jgi:hypothetical protein
MRGFTLVELLVAITAGFFVSIAAVALARQGSMFFQREARIAAAQFGSTLGFDRLRSDIARAGFMTTPNIQKDPLRCGTVSANWPVAMKSLGAILIEKNVSTTQAESKAAQQKNNLTPDRMMLTGSYSSVEWFPVRGIFPNGTGWDVYLQMRTGAIARSGGATEEALSPIFQQGRVLRMLDSSGHYEFGAISSFAINLSLEPVITLGPEPPVAMMRGTSTCGVKGNGTGMLVNVVNMIRYEIRDLQNDPAGPGTYAPLYTAAGTAPGDESRLELVRVEVDTAGHERPGTLEIVAEYAVDLKFGLSAVTTYSPSLVDPVLAQYGVGDDETYNYAADVAAPKDAFKGPERIRSVRARMTVRSREGDRRQGIDAGGGLFRYEMPGGVSFARVRTVTSDIALPNLVGTAW